LLLSARQRRFQVSPEQLKSTIRASRSNGSPAADNAFSRSVLSQELDCLAMADPSHPGPASAINP
jgi:hypothetical protein